MTKFLFTSPNSYHPNGKAFTHGQRKNLEIFFLLVKLILKGQIRAVLLIEGTRCIDFPGRGCTRGEWVDQQLRRAALHLTSRASYAWHHGQIDESRAFLLRLLLTISLPPTCIACFFEGWVGAETTAVLVMERGEEHCTDCKKEPQSRTKTHHLQS